MADFRLRVRWKNDLETVIEFPHTEENTVQGVKENAWNSWVRKALHKTRSVDSNGVETGAIIMLDDSVAVVEVVENRDE